MEKDYTYIYNQLVALYSRTKSLDLQKKCYDKIWYLVDKTTDAYQWAFGQTSQP